MATVLIGEKKGSRRANYSNRGSKFVYEETRVFIVESDVFDESPITVLLTSGLPTVFVSTITGTGGYCVCTNLNPTQNNLNGKIWEVEATFTTDIEGQDAQTNEETGVVAEDPTTWIPIYKGSFDFATEVLYKDLDDLPYVNSAGDPFPTPLQARRPITTYEFWQIEPSTVTDDEIGDRCDSVNSVPFKSWAAEKLKLVVRAFERGFFYGIEAVKIDYTLAYNRKGWRNQPIDAGYGYLESGVHVDSSNVEFLNTDGTRRDKATEDPLFLTFRENELLDFNDFLR